MDILKAEIERKKAAAAKFTNGKKYFRRGEAEAQREKEYREEQERLEQERKERQAKRLAELNPKKAPESPARTGNSRPDTPDGGGANESKQDANSGSDEENVDVDIPESELVRRFRARDEPIKLFGETYVQRARRLRKLEATEESTEGQRNDFRAAMAATEQELVMENLKRKMSDADAHDGEGEEGQYGKRRKERDAEREAVDTTIISYDLLQRDPEKTYMLLAVYFKRCLKEWDKTLDARPEDVKRTVQGRLQAATQSQTAEYMKPFFKQLKKKVLPADVVIRVCEIARFMQEREYLKANDSYLRLSIGNAPWPIGVTMVGIHERSAREKIFSSQVAHVLNDEAQRKWIQSIKRLMTFAQTRWPPDDHAKMVG